MRVSIQKSTGKNIEGQSHASDEVMLKNAVAMGYDISDVEVKEIPDKEFWAQVDAHNESIKTYADKRAEQYPSIGDQLDALFHAGVFPVEMANKIAAVKARNPKK